MNIFCISGCMFTLYVALELMTFAAVPLVSLDGRAETLEDGPALSVFAALGSVLSICSERDHVWHLYGTFDIGPPVADGPPCPGRGGVAARADDVGLLAKTALFPLHLWLPQAHAGAPAAASAVLSALVVKGSFFLIVRLWFDAPAGASET